MVDVVAPGLGQDATQALLDEDGVRLALAIARVAENLARESGRPIRWPAEVLEMIHVLEVLASNAKRCRSGNGDGAPTCGASATGSLAVVVQQPDAMLTTSEVAAALGVTKRRVRQRAAELGGVRVGRDWKFPADAAQRKAG